MSNEFNKPTPMPFKCVQIGTCPVFFPGVLGDKLDADTTELIRSFAPAASWEGRPIFVRTRTQLVHNKPKLVITAITCGTEAIWYKKLLSGEALPELLEARRVQLLLAAQTDLPTIKVPDTAWQKQAPLPTFTPVHQPPRKQRHGFIAVALIIATVIILVSLVFTFLVATSLPTNDATPVAASQVPTAVFTATATPAHTTQISPLALQFSQSHVSWTVLQGQNLTYILQALHRQSNWQTIQAVARANNVANPSMINIGQKLTIAVGRLAKVPVGSALVITTDNVVTVQIVVSALDLRIVDSPATYADGSYQQEAQQLLQGLIIQVPPSSYQAFELQGFSLHAKICHYPATAPDAQVLVQQCLAS
ncbi:MAG TPA: hypothetical protein VNG90_05365 [Candidatus Acidoferrum sp.]|nr:hypothetical protein [Candidatus Acidoferrum sp.]